MKSVLLSIKPYGLFLIMAKAMGWNIDKEKTVDVRKSFPKDDNWNKTVILYCTKDNVSFSKIPKEYQSLMKMFLGKVIGEFVCDKIIYFGNIADCPWDRLYGSVHECLKATVIKRALLSEKEMLQYGGRYGWHMSDLKIYDNPKELSEFRKPCMFGDERKCELLCLICDKSGHTPDAQIDCFNKVTRPPQSWCYVEELK